MALEIGATSNVVYDAIVEGCDDDDDDDDILGIDAEFRLPTIDIDDIQIGYPNAMVLLEHLGRMGEGNACTNRKERVGLTTFLWAECLYRTTKQERGTLLLIVEMRKTRVLSLRFK